MSDINDMPDLTDSEDDEESSCSLLEPDASGYTSRDFEKVKCVSCDGEFFEHKSDKTRCKTCESVLCDGCMKICGDCNVLWCEPCFQESGVVFNRCSRCRTNMCSSCFALSCDSCKELKSTDKCITCITRESCHRLRLLKMDWVVFIPKNDCYFSCIGKDFKSLKNTPRFFDIVIKFN
jgi:hypothetical protein